MAHWIDVGAAALALTVLAYRIARVIARKGFTERPPLGDWPHISDDMKHGERLRHD